MNGQNDRSAMRRALLWLLVAAVLLSPALLPLRQRLVLAGRPLGSALYRLGLATSPFRSPAGDSDGLEQKSEIIRLRAENQALRQQLDLDASSPFPTLAAEITGRVNDPASRSVIINRGRRITLRSRLMRILAISVPPPGALLRKTTGPATSRLLSPAVLPNLRPTRPRRQSRRMPGRNSPLGLSILPARYVAKL